MHVRCDLRYGRPSSINWEENDLLAKANYESHLKLSGPEALLFSPEGHMFVGLIDGRIISVNQSTGSIELVADFSRFQRNKRFCKTSIENKQHLVKSKCSIPLGLRFKPNTNILYVAIPFEGIFKIDTDTSKLS